MKIIIGARSAGDGQEFRVAFRGVARQGPGFGDIGARHRVLGREVARACHGMRQCGQGVAGLRSEREFKVQDAQRAGSWRDGETLAIVRRIRG